MSSTEVAAVTQQAAEIAALQDTEFDDSDLSVPILKIGQPLTREVQDENAEVGEFINTLTGDGLGDRLDFIIAYYQKGRFAADRKTNKAFVAFDEAIPEAWGAMLGEQFVGTLFTEHPDAEERYKERVNAKEIEWGHGPLISTTHNYTGLIVVPGIEGSDDPDELQPVRLSLQRTNMPAVRKLNSLKRMSLRGKSFWDKTFELSTYKKEFGSGTAHLLNVKLGRDTDAAERQFAVELATAVLAGRVSSDANAAVDQPTEPAAKGGLAV